MRYFEKFPVINYANNLVRNIVSRCALTEETKNNGDIYYPHVVQDGDRVDALADLYYDHPSYSWLIWMTNDIIDPYYDYPIDEHNFERYIIRKYGSVAIAQKYIKHYETNGDGDSTRLTVAQYEALNGDLKKYYEPVAGQGWSIIGYDRSKEQKILSTNKIISIEITGLTGSFISGEQIAINANNNAIVMGGNTSVIVAQHVTGSFVAGNVITGDYSNTSATVVSSTETANTFAATEGAYWRSVSQYDYEASENETKKSIQLMDNKFATNAETELKRVMSV